MEILTTPQSMRAWRDAHPGSFGFVPTMGYLHEGHLSLARRSRVENDLAGASIFVNPSQFGPNEDFSRYPRDEVRDLSLLEAAGMHVVYLPPVHAVYPPSFQTTVSLSEITKRLEGEARPGHFAGVATVVLKLLNVSRCTHAYFGKKDAQQLRVIQRMVRDLDLAVEIVPCEIVREADGLAMSSRNVYLSPEQRAAAPLIRRTLLEVRDRFNQGERDPDALRALVQSRLEGEELASLEYVSLADDQSLAEIERTIEAPVLLSLVVRFGSTRLLDNIELA